MQLTAFNRNACKSQLHQDKKGFYFGKPCHGNSAQLSSVGCLTSLRVVAVCGVVPWAEAFAVMHDDSRQIVGVASSVDRGTWAGAAVRFDVQDLVKSHVDADFLPVVPTRPPGGQQGSISVNSVSTAHGNRKPGLLKVRCVIFRAAAIEYFGNLIISKTDNNDY